jgi:hypothetical protein
VGILIEFLFLEIALLKNKSRKVTISSLSRKILWIVKAGATLSNYTATKH